MNSVILIVALFSISQAFGGLRMRRQTDERIVFPNEDDYFDTPVMVTSNTRRPSVVTSTTRQPTTTTTVASAAVSASPTPYSGTNIGNVPRQQFLRCMDRCKATTTSQYQPVCGTDHYVYYNQQRFDCARSCGLDVEYAGRGNCENLFGSEALGEW